jgi:hypothetical protein
MIDAERQRRYLARLLRDGKPAAKPAKPGGRVTNDAQLEMARKATDVRRIEGRERQTEGADRQIGRREWRYNPHL